jgi:LacI family transcriptional regulator
MTPPLHIALVFDYHLAYSRGVLRGIKQFAQARPHWILVPLDPEGLTVRALRAMQPSGLIALVATATLLETLQALQRSVVNVGAVLPDVPFPRVGVDHHQVGAAAARHLGERGFRHFGFVGHPLHLYSTLREAGYRQQLGRRPHTLACYHEHPARSYRRRGRLLVLNEGLQRWLRALPKPAAVFACHDVWALQVVEACRLTGLRVPDEVAVLGVDNDDLLCELARPSLSSVVVPAERIGYEAAALLERLLQRRRPPRQPRLLPPAGVVTRRSSDVLAGGDVDVNAALHFIRAHRQQAISVDDVLRVVPLSRRSLERRFRAVHERSLGEEIRQAHLERAKELLATTALSMVEIAQQSGFASAHYLCRVFRHATGQTPTAYRRQVRNPPAAFAP